MRGPDDSFSAYVRDGFAQGVMISAPGSILPGELL